MITLRVVEPEQVKLEVKNAVLDLNAPDVIDLTVTPSTTQQVFEHEGHDGYDTVTVQGAPLQSKSVTPSAQAQTVSADSGYYGLSSVEVATDTDLVAGNIKKDVEIFGVTGSYEGGKDIPSSGLVFDVIIFATTPSDSYWNCLIPRPKEKTKVNISSNNFITGGSGRIYSVQEENPSNMTLLYTNPSSGYYATGWLDIPNDCKYIYQMNNRGKVSTYRFS